MRRKIKTRNLESENRSLFFLNTVILILIGFLLWVIQPIPYAVGNKNIFVMNQLFAIGTICFLTIMEKYAITVSGLQEKIVINVLSVLYMLILMLLINVLLFGYKAYYIFWFLDAIISVFSLSILDYFLERSYNNPDLYQKPKLLIISSGEKTFLRMKRIKYGALNAYDSWYESVDEIAVENYAEFAETQIPKFDAICVLDGLGSEKYNISLKTAMKYQKQLFVVPDMIDVGKTNAKHVRFDDVLTLYLAKHYISKFDFFIKRIVDLVIACIALLITAIPMLLIAIAIKVTSPGPVFYKQERMTKGKKRFMIYKFRTMIPDAEKLTGPKFAEKDDPRITKIGKILRSCRLDELPQILNILKGDMSVVGPRPERPIFIEQFEKEIDNYNYRFAVKAGLTSLSHVYGRYSTYIHDRTYYDLLYITNYSFLFDLKIMILTTKTLFIKSAAEGEDDFKEKTEIKMNPNQEKEGIQI